MSLVEQTESWMIAGPDMRAPEALSASPGKARGTKEPI